MPEYIIDTANMVIDRKSEIIRCRDCKFFIAPSGVGYCGAWIGVNDNLCPAKPNGYCAWGDRSDA